MIQMIVGKNSSGINVPMSQMIVGKSGMKNQKINSMRLGRMTVGMTVGREDHGTAMVVEEVVGMRTVGVGGIDLKHGMAEVLMRVSQDTTLVIEPPKPPCRKTQPPPMRTHMSMEKGVPTKVESPKREKK